MAKEITNENLNIVYENILSLAKEIQANIDDIKKRTVNIDFLIVEKSNVWKGTKSSQASSVDSDIMGSGGKINILIKEYDHFVENLFKAIEIYKESDSLGTQSTMTLGSLIGLENGETISSEEFLEKLAENPNFEVTTVKGLPNNMKIVKMKGDFKTQNVSEFIISVGENIDTKAQIYIGLHGYGQSNLSTADLKLKDGGHMFLNDAVASKDNTIILMPKLDNVHSYIDNNGRRQYNNGNSGSNTWIRNTSPVYVSLNLIKEQFGLTEDPYVVGYSDGGGGAIMWSQLYGDDTKRVVVVSSSQPKDYNRNIGSSVPIWYVYGEGDTKRLDGLRGFSSYLIKDQSNNTMWHYNRALENGNFESASEILSSISTQKSRFENMDEKVIYQRWIEDGDNFISVASNAGHGHNLPVAVIQALFNMT